MKVPKYLDLDNEFIITHIPSSDDPVIITGNFVNIKKHKATCEKNRRKRKSKRKKK